MKYFIYIILAFTVTFTSCDILKEGENPETKEPQIPAGTTHRFDHHSDGSEIAFEHKTVSREFKHPFTFMQPITKTRNVADDRGVITYRFSAPLIATVDEDKKGFEYRLRKMFSSTVHVSFKKPGQVTTIATKAATPIILTTTRFKPTTKQELVDEIKKAMQAKVSDKTADLIHTSCADEKFICKALGDTADLSYIDTSAITDMSYLFAEHASGYERHTFNGNISTWDTSNVETMERIFQDATAFDQDISKWTMSSVETMSTMFQDTTSFNKDLEEWVGIGNNKDLSDAGGLVTASMFEGSATSYSRWCGHIPRGQMVVCVKEQ